MKKVIAFALSCILIFSLFVSCAQPNQPQVPDLDTQTQVILQSEDKEHSTQSEQASENQPPEQEQTPAEQSQKEQAPVEQPQKEQIPETPETSPDEPAEQPETIEKEVEKNYCTVAVYCDTILDNMEALDSAKQAIVPQDGVILKPFEVEITNGLTVFDALLEAVRKNNIHMEFSYTPGYDSTYIEGIANLYEFDCGDLSGWLYFVNGEGMGVGADQCEAMPGDEIQWHYTCRMGQDIKIKQ